MIDFYAARTPNGLKVFIMLEELGTKYNLHMLDLKNNDQKNPEYLKINPNGKIPAIVDNEGDFGRPISIFESGAILNYLADKTHHFIGSTDFERTQVMSWLMFQMSAIGPNFGNYDYAKTNDIPQMMKRFEVESKRILEVMNRQLSQHPYLAGSFYSIADIASYSWIAAYMKSKPEWFELTPHVRRWAHLIGERPAVKKVMEADSQK